MVRIFDKLYSRTSTGAIQVWWMEQDGGRYRSVSGQIDGKKVEAEWTEADCKNVGRSNSTTSEKQAEAEIQAKYKKQLKTGYHKKVEDIDKEQYFQVMLAKDYSDYKDKIDWKKGVGVQIKYNGGRIVATKDGLFTRKGERYLSIPHIEEALQPFFKKFPDAVLDGEGFNYSLRERLNEIMRLLRKTVHITPEDLQKSKELIRYYVYDGFGFGAAREDGYLKRKYCINTAFQSKEFAWRYKNIIEPVPTWYVYSEKELEILYQKFLKERHEGAILRILGVPYENKRSKYLLKYKPVNDYEFKIINIEEGNGNWSGVAKVVTCQRIDGGKFKDGTDTFNATFKGSYEEAKKCLQEKDKYIGKVATIYYNGLTGYEKPNYAQFDINNWRKS
jgi:DNA ligase-1